MDYITVMKLLTESNFDAFLADGDAPVLVDFFATWCGPCKVLTPVLESISEEFPQVRFVKVDVDASPRLAAAFGVRSMPTVVLLRPEEGGGAKTLHSAIGVKPAHYWRAMITESLAPKKSLLQRLFGKKEAQ